LVFINGLIENARFSQKSNEKMKVRILNRSYAIEKKYRVARSATEEVEVEGTKLFDDASVAVRDKFQAESTGALVDIGVRGFLIHSPCM